MEVSIGGSSLEELSFVSLVWLVWLEVTSGSEEEEELGLIVEEEEEIGSLSLLCEALLLPGLPPWQAERSATERTQRNPFLNLFSIFDTPLSESKYEKMLFLPLV